MTRKLRVVWLAPFPVETLAAHWELARARAVFHPCSWIVNLSRAMAKRPDIDLHLVTVSAQFARTQVVTVDGITYHGVRDAVPMTNRGYPPWFPVPALTGFASEVAGMLRQIDTIAPDLVHGHGTEAAYALGAVRSGRPCLISIQGVIAEYFKTDPTWSLRLLRRSEHAAVRQCRFFTCRTHFDSGFVHAVNPSARIFMIHEAMDPLFFGDAWQVQDDDNILFVGTSERRKGLRVLIEAMTRVVQHRPNAHLTIVGRVAPEAAAQLQAEFGSRGLDNKLDFVGFKRAADIAKLHRKSQLFVLPSENENSPNSLAEAMVSGMAVIATNVGGVSSMIQDGETGLLVPPQNPQRLGETIVRLLSDPAERARLGANARNIAQQRHHPDAVAEQTVSAYRDVLSFQQQS